MTGSRFLAPLVALGLAPAASAQITFPEPQHLFAYDDADSLQFISRLVAANLQADGKPDLIAVQGDQPVIFSEVASSSRRIFLGLDAADIDLLPGRDADGTDRFISGGSGGLTVWDDDASGVFQPTTYGGTGFLSPLGQVAARAHGSVDVVVTMNPAGTSYQYHLLSGASGLPLYTGAVTALPAAGGPMVLADVASGPEPELVVSHPDGLGVYDYVTGALLQMHPRAWGRVGLDPNADSLAVIEETTGPAVVWVEPFVPIFTFLQVFRHGANQATTALSGAPAVSVSACDADGTGLADDIILAYSQGQRASILFNQGPGVTFDSSSDVFISFGGPVAGNEAPAAAADLDGDGDLDVCMGVGDPSELIYLEGGEVDAGDLMPDLQGTPVLSQDFADNMSFRGKFTLPSGLSLSPTELEFTVWTPTGQDSSLVLAPGYPMVTMLSGPTEIFDEEFFVGSADFAFLQARYVRRLPGEDAVFFPAVNVFLTTDAALYLAVTGGQSLFDVLTANQKAENNNSSGDGALRPGELKAASTAKPNEPKAGDGGVVIRVPVVPLD